MAPLIVLTISFLVLRGIGVLVPWFADWQNCLRGALGAMFLLTASAHWGKRRPDLIRMVPRAFGHAALWVTFTGFAEIAIAAGLQVPSASKWFAIAAIVMMLCIFPANVKASREKLTIGGRPVPGVLVRGLIQVVFIAALAASAWPR
jgi:uncharacterized membrane protein